MKIRTRRDGETTVTASQPLKGCSDRDWEMGLSIALRWLFTNSLMAKFNLKGKGKRGKRPLEGTKVYRAIQEEIMKFDKAATEEFIKGSVSEPLKHAPQRTGGGGFSMP
ncbi:serine arginine-rich splicing factor 4-like isoform X1 [Labeo rohita]|uniref:Serine arginine-rich splicing factor 4-like isoform X1 n=1 Tax=Labeo rohita TaxID=84645 RepID=A0A498MMY7_LABRO|nr:serine arginine-rich splicing factor 4-like isoform X1 [Labeo rohita]